LLEEYEKRTAILKAKFSSSITSGCKNRAWQEIRNIVNVENSVKRYIKEIHKNGTIYVLPQKLRFLSIVRAKDKQVLHGYLCQNFMGYGIFVSHVNKAL
jgi:hypothetical protein